MILKRKKSLDQREEEMESMDVVIAQSKMLPGLDNYKMW